MMDYRLKVLAAVAMTGFTVAAHANVMMKDMLPVAKDVSYMTIIQVLVLKVVYRSI